MELNNREIALVVWTGVLLVWMLSQSDLRGSLRPVLAMLCKPVIFVPVLAFVAWVALWVLLAAQVDLWQDDLVNETVLWFLATGVVLFFGFNQAFEQDDYFQRTASRTITTGLLIEAFINFVVLPLPIELLLLPLATFLALLSAVAEGNEEQAPAKRLVDWLLGAIGIAILLYVAISLISDPGQLDADYGLRLLALPVWLTLVSLPFIYGLGLYAAYDRAFRRITHLAEDQHSARRAKLNLLIRLNVRARQVGAFDGHWQRELVDAQSPRAVISRFQRERRQLPD